MTKFYIYQETVARFTAIINQQGAVINALGSKLKATEDACFQKQQVIEVLRGQIDRSEQYIQRQYQQAEQDRAQAASRAIDLQIVSQREIGLLRTQLEAALLEAQQLQEQEEQIKTSLRRELEIHLHALLERTEQLRQVKHELEEITDAATQDRAAATFIAQQGRLEVIRRHRTLGIELRQTIEELQQRERTHLTQIQELGERLRLLGSVEERTQALDSRERLLNAREQALAIRERRCQVILQAATRTEQMAERAQGPATALRVRTRTLS